MMITAPRRVSFAPENPGNISRSWTRSLGDIQRPSYAVAAEIALQAVSKGLTEVSSARDMPLLTLSEVDTRYSVLNPEIQEAVDEKDLPADVRGLLSTGVATLVLLRGASAALNAPGKMIIPSYPRHKSGDSNTQIRTELTGRGHAVGEAMGLDEPVTTLTIRHRTDAGHDIIQVGAQTASGIDRFAELNVIPSHRTRDGNHNILMSAGTVYMGIPEMSAGTHPEALELAGRGLMVATHRF